MDNTILIQLTNQKARKLLYELEELRLIKVLKENVEPVKTRLSDKYKGFISRKLRLQNFISVIGTHNHNSFFSTFGI